MTRQNTIRNACQNSVLLERTLGVVLWTGLVAVLFASHTCDRALPWPRAPGELNMTARAGSLDPARAASFGSMLTRWTRSAQRLRAASSSRTASPKARPISLNVNGLPR